MVGETGGKDFILAHPSAPTPPRWRAALVRGAFEYQGQKCSAASRAYVPASLWPGLRDVFVAQVESLTDGRRPPTSRTSWAPSSTPRAFAKHAAAHRPAPSARPRSRILAGGGCDDSDGYFVQPTVLESADPADELFSTSIFGPILTVHVYAGRATTTRCSPRPRTPRPYALTGAVFARTAPPSCRPREALRYAAGNFYINDKPTGAVVGQQPFGGARASGTNDKAGSICNLMRWVSPRAIKELFVPPTDYRYPHMA